MTSQNQTKFSNQLSYQKQTNFQVNQRQVDPEDLKDSDKSILNAVGLTNERLGHTESNENNFNKKMKLSGNSREMDMGPHSKGSGLSSSVSTDSKDFSKNFRSFPKDAGSFSRDASSFSKDSSTFSKDNSILKDAGSFSKNSSSFSKDSSSFSKDSSSFPKDSFPKDSFQKDSFPKDSLPKNSIPKDSNQFSNDSNAYTTHSRTHPGSFPLSHSRPLSKDSQTRDFASPRTSDFNYRMDQGKVKCVEPPTILNHSLDLHGFSSTHKKSSEGIPPEPKRQSTLSSTMVSKSPTIINKNFNERLDNLQWNKPGNQPNVPCYLPKSCKYI